MDAVTTPDPEVAGDSNSLDGELAYGPSTLSATASQQPMVKAATSVVQECLQKVMRAVLDHKDELSQVRSENLMKSTGQFMIGRTIGKAQMPATSKQYYGPHNFKSHETVYMRVSPPLI